MGCSPESQENRSFGTSKHQKLANMDILQYGLQRSGTNYLKEIVLKNFAEVEFYNGKERRLPTHKHFRLYDDKSVVPEELYENDLKFATFQAFDQAAQELVGKPELRYVVVIKHPYSWYLSLTRMAREINWASFNPDADFQPQYVEDYNHFYRKWFQFAQEEPQRIFFFKYEDLLSDRDRVLSDLQQQFGLSRKKDLRHLVSDKEGQYFDVKRVRNSKHWNKDRRAYYLTEEFISRLSEAEMAGFSQVLDHDLMKAIGYDLEG